MIVLARPTCTSPLFIINHFDPNILPINPSSMRTNRATLTSTVATAAIITATSIGAVAGPVQSQEISISAVGAGIIGGANSDASNDLQGKKDGLRSVLIKTEDGEEWPIDVDGDCEIMIRTKDGGEFPVLL